MRRFITIIQESDDEYSEFSTKGHAGMKLRPADAQFGDNPMDDKTELDELNDQPVIDDDDQIELDEFDGRVPEGVAKIDKLHDIFRNAEVSDQEIKQGIQLTDQGLHKVAGFLGISPQEVKMLIAALEQHLRDDSDNPLEEAYRRFVAEDDTSGPFDAAADRDDHLSAETDYLGDITVRSAKRGKEKFYQGSQATAITQRLAGANDDAEKQAVLEPLVEEIAKPSGFSSEIKSDSGSYNFPWKIDGQSGFGTMMYSVSGGSPAMRLISIRDGAGDDVKADRHMRQALLTQARGFIADA